MKRRIRFVSLIVLATAFASGCSARQEREATLKQDLNIMREAIDNYTLDKQQPPQSLQDLVNGHYLKEIPTDPFTLKKDWAPYIIDIVSSPGQTMTGLGDVHSNSTQVGSNGSAYNTW
jgi:general secretion pathway protein G